MYALQQRSMFRTAISLTTLAMLVGAISSAGSARAAVTATGDPEDRYGAAPVVYTIDPFDASVTTRANRGITQDRKLRQTFKNPTTFNVGQINLSFDVTGGSTVGGAGDTGLKLAFYEVDDVLSGNWTPGTLIREVTLQPSTMPGSSQILRFDLTGGDVFSLPQRDAGTTGYGLEISTPNAFTSDGNPGVLFFTNQSDTDFYPDGRYYVEGGASNSFRDVGLSLVASTEIACAPGDVNCDMVVNATDLGIIAANFRKAGGRELGDLTGNGFIDFDDFGQWKSYYTGPGLGAEHFTFLAVPEPSSLFSTLALLGVLARVVRIRR